MSKPPKRPHLSIVSDPAGSKHALTRGEVADRLGVSVSTVRRYEGTRLHPTIGADGVRTFAAEDVVRLAKTLAAELEASPRAAAKAAARAEELSKGELAARVFERLEQRQSLAEIVVALRVPPDDVRALYRSWLIGLWEGELKNRTPALPPKHTEAGAVRRVAADELERMLGALPAGEATRISIGHDCDDYMIEDGTEYRFLVELGGFLVTEPIGIEEITRRAGAGTYRVTAYGFDPPGLRWEVYTKLDGR